MGSLVSDTLAWYDHVINERSDARVKDWPLMSSPFPVLGLLAVYLYGVTVWGPRYMKHRPAYSLKAIIALYNIGQVVTCVTLFYQVLTSGWLDEYTLGCEPPRYTNEPKHLYMAGLVWWTMMLKMTELVETVFFVMRKKSGQISTLHLYHHTSTLIIAWMGTKFVAGGMATFSIMANSLIHVMMYTYYLLALLGPDVQRRLNKYKKYLTILQMLQFWIIAGHSMQALSSSCEMSNNLAMIYIPNVVLVFYLFYGFYTKTYGKNDGKKA